MSARIEYTKSKQVLAYTNTKSISVCLITKKIFQIILSSVKFWSNILISTKPFAGPRSAVSNVSGYRCVSDCRSRGASSIPVRSHTIVEIDHEMISTVILLPSADSFIQEGLLSVTSESMCTNYWLTACSSLPRKKCGKVNWPSRNDHSCWLGT